MKRIDILIMKLHPKAYIMDYDFFLVYIIVLYKIILVHFSIQDRIRQASAFVPSPVLKTFILVRSSKVKLVK